MLDIEHVQNIKTGNDSDSSLKELLSRHAALMTRISYKYAKPLMDAGSSIDEINQERLYIVFKAASSFKVDRKVKFSSYLGTFTRWYCLNKINRKESHQFVNDEFLENHPAEQVDGDSKEHIHYLINKIPDKKIKKVLELRYFSGNVKLMSWNLIGKTLEPAVSGQTANNWHKKAIKIINELVKGSVDSKYGK